MQSTTISPIDKSAITACLITACHVCAYDRIRKECDRIINLTIKTQMEGYQNMIKDTVRDIASVPVVALSYQDKLAISACEIMACGACPYETDKRECERVMTLQIERG